MQEAGPIRYGLDFLGKSGLARALSPLCRGAGVIFMLHHIRPRPQRFSRFAPNAGLEISPAFLDASIRRVRALDYEIIALDDAVRRIREKKSGGSPFAVFTIDDGYRDNVDHAWPVFQRHQCPFTIFVAPGIIDGTVALWWRVLEEAIATHNEIEVDLGRGRMVFRTESGAEKHRAFKMIYWPVRAMDEYAQRKWIARFAADHGVDAENQCRQAAMSWDDVRALAGEPLCSIGAHTIHHYALSKLPVDAARAEMTGSRDRLYRETGMRPRLFAYPYGDPGSAGAREFALARDAGFLGAVTTRKGVIRRGHADRLTALPRVSLNGFYQDPAYIDVFVSGVPFMAWNAVRAVTGRAA